MQLKITDAGRAALVNPPNTGTSAVTVTQIGLTASAFTPSAAMTALPGEFKRVATIAGMTVGDDIIHVTIRDESADSYTLRGFGLYLSNGTLFAVSGQADPIMEKASASVLLLAADTKFVGVDTAQVQFGSTDFSNPPATTEVQGVVELATNVETEDGVDLQRAVTPRGLRSAVDKRFGAGAPTGLTKGLLAATTAAAFRSGLELRSAALKDVGHGNGLDADTIDGKHAVDFASTLHTHPISAVEDLQGVLDGKAQTTHVHSIGQISGLQSTLDGKSPSSHVHAIGQVTGLQSSLDGKANSTVAMNNVDASASKPVGAYVSYADGAANAPQNSGVLLNWSQNGGDGTQLWQGYTNGRLWHRQTWGGVTSAWSEVWTDKSFNPAGKVNKAGDTITGQFVISPPASDPALTLNKPGGAFSNLLFGLTNGARRWCLEIGSNALDAGGNSGSDFYIHRYNDAGAHVGAPLSIRRATGTVAINGCTFEPSGRLSGLEQIWGTGRCLVKEGAISAPFAGGRAAGLDMSSGSGRAQLFAFNYDLSAYSVPMDYNALDHSFNSRVHAPDFRAGGPIAALMFADRTSGPDWAWYSTGGSARLNLAGVGDRVTVAASGALSSVGGFDTGSSRKLKHIDGPILYTLNDLERIPTVTGRYKPDYNNDGLQRLFWDAEGLAEVIVEAVNLEGVEYNGERVPTVRNDQMGALNTHFLRLLAIRDREQHEVLQDRVDQLEKLICHMKERIVKLEGGV